MQDRAGLFVARLPVRSPAGEGSRTHQPLAVSCFCLKIREAKRAVHLPAPQRVQFGRLHEGAPDLNSRPPRKLLALRTPGPSAVPCALQRAPKAEPPVPTLTHVLTHWGSDRPALEYFKYGVEGAEGMCGTVTHLGSRNCVQR